MRIFIKQLDPELPLPSYQTPGAVAFDIAVRESGKILPGERKKFSTGLIIKVPTGYALLVASRSSNTKKGLTLSNGIGILDQDYCGPEDELHLVLYNLGKEPYSVQKGERLAQGLLVPIIKAEFELITELNSPSRGGFGTTG